MSNTRENLRSLRRRVPLGVQLLAVLAVGSVLLLGMAAFADLPGPSVFYDEPGAAYCVPDGSEVRAPAEPPPGPGEWRREPNGPNVEEVQATTVGDRVFVGTGTEPDGDQAVSLDKLFAFDPRSGQYEEPTTTPEPLDHTQFVSHGGDLYVVGGFSNGQPTDRLWRYSPDDGQWTELEGMRQARGAHGAAVIGDRLYVVGGGTTYAFESEGIATIATMEVYDFTTGEWRDGPDLPTRRHHFGLAALDGQLYAVGGRDGSDYALDAVERFDPGTGRWEVLPPLPEGSGALTVTAAGGEVNAVGGGDDDQVAGEAWVSPATWAFDPGRGQWRRAGDLEVPRHGHAAAEFDGRLYLFGGSPCLGLGRTHAVESLATR
jgi:N-acetylneuraminic acid mutarotase